MKDLSGICDGLCAWAAGTGGDVRLTWQAPHFVKGTCFRCKRVCVCVFYNREVVLMCWMQWRDAFYVAPHFANVTLSGRVFCVAGTTNSHTLWQGQYFGHMKQKLL